VGYLGAGFVLLAMLGGTGGGASGSCPVVPIVAPPSQSPTASASASPSKSSGPSTTPSPAVPASLSASPVLTQQPSGTWTTTIYLNTAALCPAQPSFELVTTSPDLVVLGNAEYHPQPDCGTPMSAATTPLTQVQLTFGPCSQLARTPVTAAVVVTPADPTSLPVQITVAVHRRVSWWQYAWVPLLCGAGLALAVVGTVWLAGLPDPDTAPGQGQRRARLRHGQFWHRPLYAAGAWTFGGSWATNITALGAVIAAVLTATGAVSELLPGVELGRFSLLVVLAGGITVAAPLVFGALNYRFGRLDPTTLGVSVITLPGLPPGAPPPAALPPGGLPLTTSPPLTSWRKVAKTTHLALRSCPCQWTEPQVGVAAIVNVNCAAPGTPGHVHHDLNPRRDGHADVARERR
jgi:hypothetical protein